MFVQNWTFLTIVCFLSTVSSSKSNIQKYFQRLGEISGVNGTLIRDNSAEKLTKQVILKVDVMQSE